MEDLRVFTDPASVAVVGASANPAKWGYWLARGALKGAGRRQVDLVNAAGATIDGVGSAHSLAALDHTPELVVLCTPAAQLPDIVDQALAMGTRGFLGIAAGLGNVLGDPDAERHLAERIRAAGARLIGPNCLGIYDAAHDLELAWGTFTPGHLGVVSQSGQLGLEIAGLAARSGLGISRFVSVGNQTDVTAVDVLLDLVDDDHTRAVIVYLEDFAAGRTLVDVFAQLRRSGKPVLVLTVGASEASRAAARSHTGSLTSASDVVAAACRSAGAMLVETPAQAVDLAHLLLGGPLPHGRRVAVVSDSGGQGAVATDVLERVGLATPHLSDATQTLLRELLPPSDAVANPVDLAGCGEQDLTTYARVVDVLLGSEEIDTVILTGYFGCYGSDTPSLAESELEVVAMLAGSAVRHDRPVLVHSMSYDSATVQSLRQQLVPTLNTIDATARSLAAAVEIWERRDAVPPGLVAPPVGGSPHMLDYLSSRDILVERDVPFPKALPITTPGDISVAMGHLRAPYALKATWLEHKTEVGGVALGLTEETDVLGALTDMRLRLGSGSFVLEEMDTQSDVVELIVGTRRDPSFGPVILVGAGGITAELLRDTVLALAPIDETQAGAMLRSLRSAPLLAGWRGRPAVDVDAAARVIAALSRLLAERPDISEAEINPLRVGPQVALAVDALIQSATMPTPGATADDEPTKAVV